MTDTRKDAWKKALPDASSGELENWRRRRGGVGLGGVKYAQESWPN